MATLSTELAIIAKVVKYAACLSRGITCVEIGSTFKLSFFATYASILGSMLAYVPTGPEIAQVEISFIDISTTHYKSKPKILLKNELKDKYTFLASVSHEKNYAISFVIAFQNENTT